MKKTILERSIIVLSFLALTILFKILKFTLESPLDMNLLLISSAVSAALLVCGILALKRYRIPTILFAAYMLLTGALAFFPEMILAVQALFDGQLLRIHWTRTVSLLLGLIILFAGYRLARLGIREKRG